MGAVNISEDVEEADVGGEERSNDTDEEDDYNNKNLIQRFLREPRIMLPFVTWPLVLKIFYNQS